MLLVNETTLTYKIQFGQFGIKNTEFYLSPVSIWLNILQSNKHTLSHWKTSIQTLQIKINQLAYF